MKAPTRDPLPPRDSLGASAAVIAGVFRIVGDEESRSRQIPPSRGMRNLGRETHVSHDELQEVREDLGQWTTALAKVIVKKS
jgi:hypothetical protein